MSDIDQALLPTAHDMSFLRLVPTHVLVAAASGAIDLNRLAGAELTARGLDSHGMWIGIDRSHGDG